MASRTFDPQASISGHVWLYEGKRRSTWCAKWRDQQGQHERRLGPAWTTKGPPAPGFLRERDAQALLDAILVDARRGQLQQQRTGLTFADIAEGVVRARAVRAGLVSKHAGGLSLGARRPPAASFWDGAARGDTGRIERWRDGLTKGGERGRQTANKIVTQLHGILEHAVEHHGLVTNAAAKVKRLRVSTDPSRYDFFAPEEIKKLVSAAAAGPHRKPGRRTFSGTELALQAAENRQDGVIYLTAALAGLRRSELLALRWEDIDFKQSSIRVFEGYSAKQVGKTKSRKSRVVPMVQEVADVLRDLKTRDTYTSRTNLVFVSRDGTHLDGSALRRRYIAALDADGLRRLRFHDLRHTFGSLAINVASIVQVQAWMGHADIKTTMRYLHHKSRADDAQLLSAAFRTAE